MDTDPRVRALRSLWQESAGLEFDRLIADCESPIESLFLATMLAGNCGVWEPAILADWAALRELEESLSGCSDRKSRNRKSRRLTEYCTGAACITQCVVRLKKTYRIDFAFFDVTRQRRYAVELDGHDFHERTKEQAERDRSRDRALTAAGWTCLRFTGREVNRDPDVCLEQVEEFLRRDRDEAFQRTRAGQVQAKEPAVKQ